MTARQIILNIFIAYLFAFGWITGLEGLNQFGTGYLWVLLVSACPFFLGIQLTLIFNME